MKPRRDLAIAALAIALAIVLFLIARPTLGAAPGSNLEPRVAALEAKVADLQTRVAALESSQIPVPTPSPSGWTLAFEDTFNDRTTARGHFLDGSPDAYHTADGRYAVYKWGWTDTSGNGSYSPGIIEVANGLLDAYIHTPSDGKHHVAAFTALPSGATPKGGLVSMRCEVRIRADLMVGYKGVPMCGWADAATTNDLLLTYGEIDFPESNFDKPPSAFMHRTNATSFGDQAFFPTTASWQDWHTYATEWRAGESVEFFLDGVSIGKTTERIPTTAMHANFQFETWTNGTIPDSSVAGHVQIDWIRLWSR